MASWIFTRRIVASCDVYFYNVGKLLGIDRIDHYATGSGPRPAHGNRFAERRAGLIPSEEWVERVDHHKWYPGSTISVAIGQGAVMVTPDSARSHDCGRGQRRHADPAASFEECRRTETSIFSALR